LLTDTLDLGYFYLRASFFIVFVIVLDNKIDNSKALYFMEDTESFESDFELFQGTIFGTAIAITFGILNM